jgi:hypothetical protein
MFAVNVGGTNYRVCFKHFYGGTTCYIYVSSVKATDGEVIAVGIANRNPSDTPNKSMGRKIALGRALTRKSDDGTRIFPKSESKVFWDAYFAKLRDSKREKVMP